MKKLVLVLLLTLLTVTANAAILCVSKLGNAQYSEVQPAINTASPGDTILISPSPAYYQAFTIDRQLTLIGAGWDTTSGNTTGTQVASPVIISGTGDGVILRNILIVGAVYNNAVFRVQSGASNVLVEECWFQNTLSSENDNTGCVSIDGADISFVKCCFWRPNLAAQYGRGLSVSGVSQIIIQSCVFSHCYVSIYCPTTSSNITITHCIFDQYNGSYVFNASAYGIVQNSVSVGSSMGSPANFSINYCASSGTVPSGIGNIPIVGGEFVNLVQSNPRQSDYHLTETSPLRDAGNPASPPDLDSTPADMGVYGGQIPYDEFGIPNYPFVLELSVSPVVPQNGVMRVFSRGRVGSGN